MTLNRNQNGYDISSRNYFSKLNQQIRESIKSARRQSVCEARKKLDWQAFEFLMKEANQDKLLNDSNFRFKGHLTRAIDGTSLLIPHSKDILTYFKQRKDGTGGYIHYPLALLVTATNVFTGQITTTRISGFDDTNERNQLISMLDEFDSGDLCLLDRGFTGLRIYSEFSNRKQYFICRVVSSGKRVAGYIKQFVHHSKDKSTVITEEYYDEELRKTVNLKIRLVRGPKNKDGEPIIFATNLFDKDLYTSKSISQLYRERWSIGVSSKGHINPVGESPTGVKDSSSVARKAS